MYAKHDTYKFHFQSREACRNAEGVLLVPIIAKVDVYLCIYTLVRCKVLTNNVYDKV